MTLRSFFIYILYFFNLSSIELITKKQNFGCTYQNGVVTQMISVYSRIVFCKQFQFQTRTICHLEVFAKCMVFGNNFFLGYELPIFFLQIIKFVPIFYKNLLFPSKILYIDL